MKRILPNLFIWLGSWLCYFPAVDFCPMQNPYFFDSQNTVEVLEGKAAFTVMRSKDEAKPFGLLTQETERLEAHADWKVWFFGTGLAVLAFSLLLVYRNRMKDAQNELKTLKKMREMEQAALRSQMNPHFIFNALNSIQGFIVDGDKKSATRYLAKFSRLVRSTLHHSSEQQISLATELKMLNQYLELEKLRFRDDFDYSITMEPGLDQFDRSLPPMLVQPFVENAIIHGLGPKNGKGKVWVHFKPNGNGLLVSIKDNGVGMEASKKKKKDKHNFHKSLGMKLTNRRLQLLENGVSNNGLKIIELNDENGMAVGTEIRLELN